jgi:hypothetical protein
MFFGIWGQRQGVTAKECYHTQEAPEQGIIQPKIPTVLILSIFSLEHQCEFA